MLDNYSELIDVLKNKRNFMSCLVIAELENGIPNRPSLAAISASLN